VIGVAAAAESDREATTTVKVRNKAITRDAADLNIKL
jgi:hypothetical protein